MLGKLVEISRGKKLSVSISKSPPRREWTRGLPSLNHHKRMEKHKAIEAENLFLAKRLVTSKPRVEQTSELKNHATDH